METQSLNDLTQYSQKYAYTAYLSRRDWAYEYLRRVPAFEQAAWNGLSTSPIGRIACHDITVMRMRSRQPAAEAWGLKFFPNPEIPAPKAHVFWTEKAHPDILDVNVSPRAPNEKHPLFDETIRKCRMAHLTDENGQEHLIVYGRGCSVQVRANGHTLVTTKPVKTSFSVSTLSGFEEYVEILRRSKNVYGDHITDPAQFSRKALLLRNGLITLDGQRAGLSDRQIAWIINGMQTVEEAVAQGDRSLINRVSYYRENAAELCAGGYKAFLQNQSDLEFTD